MSTSSTVYEGALGSVRPNDVQISVDGSTIYAAGDDGNLYVYSAATGALLHTWDVGTQLGGLDISPDGSFAIAVELQPLSHSYPSYDEAQSNVTVYKIDLASGQVTSYPTTLFEEEFAFFDVAIQDNDTVLLNEQIRSFFTGSVPMRELNLATGQYSMPIGSVYYNSVLSPSVDGSYTFVGEVGISPPRAHMVRDGMGIVATNWVPLEGANRGVQAVSAEAGIAAQGLDGDIHIFDLDMGYYGYLSFEVGVAGVTFDGSGEYLFVLTTDDVIHQIFTPEWFVTKTFDVAAGITTIDGDFGNRLLVSPDMSYFTVVTEDGLEMVDASPITESADDIIGTLQADVIDSLGGDDWIWGRAGDDQLSGGAGNDVLWGEEGTDILIGGAGDDTLDGGAGVDTVDYWTATQRVIVALADSGANATGQGVDTLIGIENVEGSNLDDRLFGDAGRNVFLGRAGDDTIEGRGGADLLFGGDGNDTLDGGADNDRLEGGGGNDVLIGGPGNDTLDGGAGNDTVDYRSSSFGLTMDLATSGPIPTGDGADTLIGIENIEGSLLSDTLSGGSAANVFLGRAGSDTIHGRGGGDTLFGGADRDFLYGGEGNDRIEGNDGDDEIHGGAGNDRLTGDTGADVFVFADLGGTDIITDFAAEDEIDLRPIDANSGVDGDQAFVFIGANPFTAGGQVRAYVSGGTNYVAGDVNGDGVPDILINLGSASVVGGDFLL